MNIIDLTHSIQRKERTQTTAPVVVRSATTIDKIKLDYLVSLATVVDLKNLVNEAQVLRRDILPAALSGIRGCILSTGWCDRYLAGAVEEPPVMDVSAAACLLEAGVRTIAADFPITNAAADMLMHNNAILIHCVSNVDALSRNIVRLIALPLKISDTYSAEARVIALEE